MTRWLSFFAVAQAMELPIYAVMLRPLTLRRRLAAGFTASALTHPWVWSILSDALIEPLGYPAYVVIAEVFAWAAEAALLTAVRVPWRVAMLASLVANAASLAAGFVVSATL